MQLYTNKTQENKNKAVGNDFSVKQSSGDSAFKFVDNRPVAIAQRKLQEMVNNSPQALQMRKWQEILDYSPQVQQADSMDAGTLQMRPLRVFQKKRDKIDSNNKNITPPNYPLNTLIDLPYTVQLREFNSFYNPNNRVVQRVLTLDNGDFSEVNEIKKLGGNAEGAYLVSDGSGQVVLKISDRPDSTVMAYNLAKDFGIKIPKGRYLELDSPAGKTLKSKALELNKELSGKLKGAKAVILWEFIPGETLDQFKDKSLEDPKVSAFRKNSGNFIKLGKMLVFDAAILNADRFKMAFDQPLNAGNLMIANNEPIGLDQDFARIDAGEGDSPGSNITDYGKKLSKKMKPLLSNPKVLSEKLVKKMIKEKFILFKGQEENIEKGIREGIKILRRLLKDENGRLEDLIKWSKTFQPDTDLNPKQIKEYWKNLLPKGKKE